MPTTIRVIVADDDHTTTAQVETDQPMSVPETAELVARIERGLRAPAATPAQAVILPAAAPPAGRNGRRTAAPAA